MPFVDTGHPLIEQPYEAEYALGAALTATPLKALPIGASPYIENCL